MNTRTTTILIVAVTMRVFLAAFAIAQTDDISDKQKELDRIKKEIQAHREKSKQLSSQEKQTAKQLQSLDKELDLGKQYVSKLNDQENSIDQRIGELMIEISGRERTLSAQEKTLGKRLRQMYKQDPHYSWDLLLGAKSMNDAVRRYQFMHLVAQADAQIIGTYRESKKQLETESSRLGESMQQIAEVRADKEAENKNLEANKRKRQDMLVAIRSEKSKHVDAIKDLEQAQAELQNLLDDLQRRGTPEKDLPATGEFAALRGRMMWPVAGKIIRGYGKHTHPKYGTVTMNNGVDISASSGAPIVAVAAGVVEFVDWIDSFGKCVILNHGGGYYTLYAHVADTSVSQGQKIGRGQVIASVGDTGSLDGYVCHFEIRKGRGALDPAEWLARKPNS
ncbi:MAG TPA: peptidoglycan DD-metalloendopeptidase family protein [Candidatus Krumholzibacteria bacterium]|nr:peptidoglycan DD-metalloendopeptidase family protein [Candidatus Krumholzibacteria bacterium]